MGSFREAYAADDSEHSEGWDGDDNLSEESEGESLDLNEFDEDGSEDDLTWDEVLQTEREFIQKQHRGRERQGGCVPFSVAFSGGGVRAAAFEAGVLWRLAQAGRLGDVEHFVAVSGGAYLASAFCSQIIAAGSPRGQEEPAWYLGIVAKTICRMQKNAGYLVRDISKGSWWRVPQDGSSRLPPILDVPVLAVVMLATMIVNPLTVLVVYLVPITEGVDSSFGANMRAAYCAPTAEEAWAIYGAWGPLPRLLNILEILVIITFLVWICSQAPCAKLRPPKVGKRTPCLPLMMTSTRAVLVRVCIILGIFLLLMVGIMCSQQMAVHKARHEFCGRFIREHLVVQIGNHTSLSSISREGYQAPICQDLIGEFPWWFLPEFDHYLDPNATKSKYRYLNQTNWVHRSSRQQVELPLFRVFVELPLFRVFGGLQPFRTIFMLSRRAGRHLDPESEIYGSMMNWVTKFMLYVLGVALVLTAFVRGLFCWVLSFAGPFMALVIVAHFFQYRIFGPLTGQYYFQVTSLLPFQRDTWDIFLSASLVTAMVILLFYHSLHFISHAFYTRSLRQAYFNQGQDRTWSELCSNFYCPFLLLTGTVTDYRRPGNTQHISEIFMSPLHTGGENTGYVSTPPWRSLAKCTALAAAATDAFILGMLDRIRYRFWLEFFNLRMGDYILFEKQRYLWVDRVNRYCKLGKERPLLLYQLPMVLCLATGLAMFSGASLVSREQLALRCNFAGDMYKLYFMIMSSIVILSFFAFMKPLEFFLHSPAIRHLHMAMRYYHQADKPPSMIYVTDGGVQDCTGVLQLMTRRSARILLALAASDPDDNLAVLRETLRIAAARKIGSFYDPRDPRRSVSSVLDEFKEDRSKTFLVLGIRYGWGARGARAAETFDGLGATGRLFVVKNRLPPSLEDFRPEVLLSEAEILRSGRESAQEMPARWEESELRQSDLGGCCCDCCHSAGCNIGPKFPHLSNANQFLTPELFSSLCRLGYRLSADAVHAISQDGQLEEPWERGIV